MAKPIHIDLLYHDGRGPELQRTHWSTRGAQLQTIEYFNPDDVFDEASIKHVRFDGLQVVMITPEEVIDYGRLASHLEQSRAAMFDLGKTMWLQSFSQRHLSSCRHFQLMFYDQLFDIICERVPCHRGRFASVSGN
jgi:hypothetical protein